MTFDEWVDQYRPNLNPQARNTARALVNGSDVTPQQGFLCPFTKTRGSITCTCRLPVGHVGHHDLVSSRW